MRAPLVLPFAFFAAGLLLARGPLSEPGEDLLAALAFLLLAILAHRFAPRRWLTRQAIRLAVLTLGAYLAARQATAPKPMLPAPMGVPFQAELCVVDPPADLARPQVSVRLAGQVNARLSIDAKLLPKDRPIVYGDRLRATLVLRPFRGFRNPGAFDMAAWMERRDLLAAASLAPKTELERLPGRCGSLSRSLLSRLRTAALQRLDGLWPESAYHRAMMRGLLLGEATGIRRVWIEEFRRTGTYHALVISGTHVTLVCGLLLVWLRWFGYGRRSVLVATAAAAWLYAALAGGEAPVARAAAGMALYALGQILFRRASLLNLTAAVAFVFLAIEPRQLYDASFLLSFLAVAALGVMSDRQNAPGAARRARLARAAAGVRMAQWAEFLNAALRLPPGPAGWCARLAGAAAHWTWSVIVLSLLVQVGLTLPMVYFFHRLSATAVAANVAVGALIGLAIPIALLALFAGWVWVGSLAALLLDWTRASAEFFAAWEPSWRIPDPPLWLAVAVAATTVATAFFYRARSRWAIPTAALLAVPMALLILHPFEPRVWRGWLELTAIDVGQGESLLLCPPSGDPMLVDGGGLPARVRSAATRLDLGEDVVAPYLWRRGIRRLSAIAVTHLHEDHAQGVPALIEAFRPREVWTGFAPRHPAWLAIESSARAAGARVRILREGERLAAGGAEVTVLAPRRDQAWAGEPRNNDSLVFRVAYGRHALLLTGDADSTVEERLLETAGSGRADVLKAGHHGSRRSSFPPFLDAVKPAFAVISAGRDNRFGLPSLALLERLTARHVTILRTDAGGLVTLRTDGCRFHVEHPAAAVEPWELLGLE